MLFLRPRYCSRGPDAVPAAPMLFLLAPPVLSDDPRPCPLLGALLPLGGAGWHLLDLPRGVRTWGPPAVRLGAPQQALPHACAAGREGGQLGPQPRSSCAGLRNTRGCSLAVKRIVAGCDDLAAFPLPVTGPRLCVSLLSRGPCSWAGCRSQSLFCAFWGLPH
ncbi:unnamed protein product [Rangifer tarandus platyrhynchus]|uniref:Uncharacterized protein n=1 Tax=Rangifer tarandus platyrhynchus TaxID=3082113 RepID=A0ABN8ZDI7_RANTA|nr:unnamed protein product [Rangifer tarandus platyrhynchus]